MTISGYSNAIVDCMLGWLKGLANWVLRLFNLAGSVTTSPLMWLSKNWLKLLIFFLVLGIVLDLLIWLIRWRPYWVWFRKERVIVDDSRFFMNADIDRAPDWEGDLLGNWDEHDYVVASTVVKRQSGGKGRGAQARGGRRPPDSVRAGSSRRRAASTKVERHDGASGSGAKRLSTGVNGEETEKRVDAGANDNIFATSLKKPKASDVYEDEVFNVTNLPAFDEYGQDSKNRRKSGKSVRQGGAGRREGKR